MRVAIGPSSFAAVDKTPQILLEQAGLEIVPNPYSRRLTEEEIIAHLQGVDGLIAGLEPLNRKVFATVPQLKVIARVGIGMDNVDQQAAADLGIKVSNTPDGPTEAVAEMCLANLLALGRQLISFNTDLHNGAWAKRIGFGPKGLKVLLIGYGRIGRRFAEVLRFFGAEILVADPYLKPEILQHGEQFVSLEQGLNQAEVVSMHASGVDSILNEEQFQQMRPGMIVLNSARAELIDENALINALEAGVVAGAWLDAFWKEPYTGRLADFPQVIMTPHVCTYTRQCRRSMEEEAVRNLLRDLEIG